MFVCFSVFKVCFFFFKQKTEYEGRISDWSSDVCSSDLVSSGSALRIPVVEGINPRVWRDGNAWVVDLRPQAARPDVPLRIDAQMVSPQGPRLFIPTEGVGRPIVAQDPEVGDGLFIDRTSVVSGKSVSVWVDLGGRRIIKKKKNK